MKNIFKKIIIGFVLIIGLSGCEEEITDINYKVVDECSNKPELLLNDHNINIYTYCLNDMEVNVENIKVKLDEYISNNDDWLEKITNEIDDVYVLSDGGTKIYKGSNITVIKCNTLYGNKDVYIGNKDLEFKENFCKDNNYTFVRTYTVKDIEEYTEQQYTSDGIPVSYSNSFKVTLSQFQKEEVSVIINNLWDIKLEKDKIYEFEFKLYDSADEIEDNINYIFKNADIVEVRETNKVGLEQLQEEIK